MSEVDAFMSRLMSNLDGSKDAEIKRLRKALERAAGRFNLMAGVGLVNGADPKVGYRECMDALDAVGDAPKP